MPRLELARRARQPDEGSLARGLLNATLRRAAVGLAGLGIVVALLFMAAGWYYAGVIHSGALVPREAANEADLRVVDVREGVIVLAELPGKAVEELRAEGVWGLEAQSGYGQLGAVLDVHSRDVAREFRLLSGSIRPGDLVRLDSFAFDGDPSNRGLMFQDVLIHGPLGQFPAWKVEGNAGTWVIFIHGWRSQREEALRILPAVASLGLTSLAISYRNATGAPASQDGLIWWGAREWQDVEAAVDYALSEGANSVVLFGFSMGGGIALRFLQESDRARFVAGAILDSPVVDFNDVLAFQARRRHLPGLLLGLAKQFVDWRYGFDFGVLDNAAHLDRLRAPILLFHGDEDDRVPIETSRRLAEARPDIITFVAGAGAGHVRSWNLRPESYEREVQAFLTRILALSR